MHHMVHRPNWLAVTGIVLAGVVAAVAISVALLERASSAQTFTCSGVQINPGDDIDAKVNNDPGTKATTFCVHASSSGTTYPIDKMVVLKTGDKLLGEPGEVIRRGPASYGAPLVRIRPQGTVGKMISLRANVRLSWLDIGGAKVEYNKNGSPVQGTGTAIRAGETTANSVMEYLVIHDNANQGIGTMIGKVRHSEFYNNGTSTAFGGVTAAAVKGIDEYEAAYNYVHDNPANGLWCDVGCDDAGAAQPNGFWVHHNLVVDNGRWGIKYESAPQDLATGVHRQRPSALIENNSIHHNGHRGESGIDYGGAGMRDAQNGTFRNNRLGPTTIAGVRYGTNVNGRGIYFGDSGRASRTDLWNGRAVGNSMGGETIVNCDKPDNIVYCAGNK